MSETDDVMLQASLAAIEAGSLGPDTRLVSFSPSALRAVHAHIDRLARELREAKEELRGIDEVMARRPALDQVARRDKIEHAISVAKRCDAAEAEVARLREVIRGAANAGVQVDEPRLTWVELQMERDDWQALVAAAQEVRDG